MIGPLCRKRRKQSIQGIVMQVVVGDDATERKLKWTPFIPDICHIPVYRWVGQRCIFNVRYFRRMFSISLFDGNSKSEFIGENILQWCPIRMIIFH